MFPFYFYQNPKKAKCTRKYITVEAIYANIGDICPLPKIIRLRNKYKARIILDESISLGVLGKNGRGLTEHFGLTVSELFSLLNLMHKNTQKF